VEAREKSDLISHARSAPLWGIFVSPVRTFGSLCEQPRWFVPLAFAAAFSMAVDYYATSHIGFESLVRGVAKSAGTLDPEGMVQNALAHKIQILAIQSAGSFLGVFATAMIVALILWLLVLGVGGEVKFKSVLAVLGHVNLGYLVVRQSMLALSVSLCRDPASFDLRNPLATNVGFFVQSSSPITARILSSLDLVTFTAEVLVVIGLTKVSPGLSRATSCVIVFLPWSLFVALRAWMAAWQ